MIPEITSSEYVRSLNQRILTRQMFWNAEAVSAATGEPVQLNYYQSIAIPDDQDSQATREFREIEALGRIGQMIAEAKLGRGYIVHYNRVGVIQQYVESVINEDFDPQYVDTIELRAKLRRAIEAGNAEYERHRAAAIRLGADPDKHGRWGLEIPIHPLQETTQEVPA